MSEPSFKKLRSGKVISSGNKASDKNISSDSVNKRHRRNN